MCRHLAYLGPPVPVAELLFGHPHSLARQSWAPADMRGGGTVNVDGFGVGWYPGEGRRPVRYRRATPIWADAGLEELTRSVRSHAVLAAVRSATASMSVAEGACAPFADGDWLFSHNGRVQGWPSSMSEQAATLPVTDLLTLEAPVDSALVWALVRDRLRAGQNMAKAVSDVVSLVERAAPGSRLNLLLTDGRSIVAASWTHSLAVLRLQNTVVVASEPYDDDHGWTMVPDRRLVVASQREVEVRELEGDS